MVSMCPNLIWNRRKKLERSKVEPAVSSVDVPRLNESQGEVELAFGEYTLVIKNQLILWMSQTANMGTWSARRLGTGESTMTGARSCPRSSEPKSCHDMHRVVSKWRMHWNVSFNLLVGEFSDMSKEML